MYVIWSYSIYFATGWWPLPWGNIFHACKLLALSLVQLVTNLIEKSFGTCYLQLMLIACRTPRQVFNFTRLLLDQYLPSSIGSDCLFITYFKVRPTVMIVDYRRPPHTASLSPSLQGSVWSSNELKESQANLWHCILYRFGWEQKQGRSIGWHPKSLLGRGRLNQNERLFILFFSHFCPMFLQPHKWSHILVSELYNKMAMGLWWKIQIWGQEKRYKFLNVFVSILWMIQRVILHETCFVCSSNLAFLVWMP